MKNNLRNKILLLLAAFLMTFGLICPGVSAADARISYVSSVITPIDTPDTSSARYTVRYRIEGSGTIEGNATQNVSMYANTSAVKAIAAEGYRFVEWSDGNTNATRYERNVSAGATYYAIFEQEKVSIISTDVLGSAQQNSGSGGNDTGGGESIPDYGKKAESNTWSLLSLLCTLITAVLGVKFLIREKKNDEEIIRYRTDISKLIGMLAAIAAVALAFIFISFSSKMAFVNGSMVWFAFTTLIQLINGFLGEKKSIQPKPKVLHD